MDLLSPEEALARITGRVQALPAESAPLSEAVDRVLAEDVVAQDDLPPYDGSAMDGYAVRSSDCRAAGEGNPVRLALKETLRAGALARETIRAGEAARIMTGAPMPRGADAVVMQEYARSGGEGKVEILRAPAEGSHIRRRGEDVRRGARVLSRGAKIRPYEVAMLAAQGIARLRVIRKAAVSILATGDELVDLSAAPAEGQIRNSNGPAIFAALERWGARPWPPVLVKDDLQSLRTAVNAALARADMLLVSGGVSVGDFDYTKEVLEEAGLEVVFWKVAIKPGKPLLFGLWRGKPVFGLPGNPVSAMVCVEEFVRPAVEALHGLTPSYPSYHLRGVAANDYPKPADRLQYLFCRATREGEGYRLEILRPQGSAMVGMACAADALAVAPAGVSRVRSGDTLAFRWLK